MKKRFRFSADTGLVFEGNKKVLDLSAVGNSKLMQRLTTEGFATRGNKVVFERDALAALLSALREELSDDELAKITKDEAELDDLSGDDLTLADFVDDEDPALEDEDPFKEDIEDLKKADEAESDDNVGKSPDAADTQADIVKEDDDEDDDKEDDKGDDDSKDSDDEDKGDDEDDKEDDKPDFGKKDEAASDDNVDKGAGTPDSENDIVQEDEDDDKVDEDDAEDDKKADESIDVLMRAAKLDPSAKNEVKTVLLATAGILARKMIRAEKKRVQMVAAKKLAEHKAASDAKVETYLKATVAEWHKKNKPAIRGEARVALAESLVTGIKGLLERHGIEVPKDKVDAFKRLTESHDKLARSYSELSTKFEAAQRRADEASTKQTVATLTEGMSRLEAERFKGMLENFEFTDVEDFNRKARIIHENFYKGRRAGKLILEDDTADRKRGKGTVIVDESAAHDDVEATLRKLQS